jgi:hypothetical protein
MTSALHAEGPRFDPGLVYFLPQGRARAGGVRARAERRQTGASIAQMVERKTLNLVVVGSIPTGGAPFCLYPGRADEAGGGPAGVGTHSKPL